MNSGQTIFLTGGAGYIGSVTTDLLVEKGYNVIVFDNLEKGHREAVSPSVCFIEGDLRDDELVKSVFCKHKIDAVMHFGAYSLVAESMSNPDKYFSNNVQGGHVLLNAMRDHGVKRIVFSSTAAVYGNPEKTPIEEDICKEPINPYGRSKLAFEYMLKSFEEAYGIQHASLRYFNAAGATRYKGEDHHPETHLIPLILHVALGKRDKIMIFGTDYKTSDGTCVRDYIHVSDLANAHVLALEQIKKESIVCNLGNGLGFTVRQVVETSRAVTGHPIPASEKPRRPGDPAVLTASSERARRILGWEPKYDLKQIIEDAWKWHSEHPNGYGT